MNALVIHHQRGLPLQKIEANTETKNLMIFRE